MKYVGRTTGHVFDVVFSDDEGVLTVNETGHRHWWPKGSIAAALKEYREPRTIKGYVNIWERPDGSASMGVVYPTRENASEVVASHKKRLDIIEISWTEEV